MTRISWRPAVAIGLGVAMLGEAAGRLCAQVPVPPQAPMPVFRAVVDHVAVDVVVTDKNDRPVTDLTKDEFEVVEKGKPQAIADFQFVSIPVVHRALDPKTAVAFPEPDVATNIAASAKSRTFVVVIDDLHLMPMDIVPTQRLLTEFVNTLSADDEVAIVFVRSSNYGINFTRDPVRMLAGVAGIKSAIGIGEDLPTAAALGKSASMQALQDARSTSFVLKNAAATLVGSGRARRAIVYLGTYSVLDPSAPLITEEASRAQMAQQYLNDAFAAARRSDVPIYAIDPRGIPLPEKDSLHPPLKPEARQEMMRRIGIQQDHLVEIAENTGGRAFINRPEQMKAMDELVAENSSFYLLGYYPDPFTADAKEHTFDVHVKRPGLRVRARSEYVASASTTPAGLKELATDAMSSGINLDGLSLSGWVAPVAATPKGLRAAVAAELTYPMAADGPHHMDDEVVVSVLALDSDGKIQASSSHPWNLKGDAYGVTSVQFLFNDVIDVPARALTIRIGMASRAMAKAGTIQLPFVPAKASTGGLRLGGVVLGAAIDPREHIVGAELLQGVVPFQPVTARTFTSTGILRVYVPVFWDSKDATVAVTVGLAGDSSRTSRMDVSPTAKTGDVQTAVVDRQIALTGLAPGDYVLEITAAVGEKGTAKRTVPFTIR